MAINNSGYSSNQFKNISLSETNPLVRTTDDNPDFMYPGHSIPNVYDDLSKGPLGRLPVQRGFIRGIFPEIVNRLQEQENSNKKKPTSRYTGVEAPVRRCFFQFNPSMILRSVQASSTTLNPLLQNPTQLLQAIPGQASFEFQILFNREYEVAGQVYRTGNGRTATTPYSQVLDNYGATSDTPDDPNTLDNEARLANPYLQSHVGDLGVLTDLYVLDSIIGQSITQDSIDSILAYWQASKNLRGTGEKDSEGKEINPYKDGDFTDSGEYAKGLNNVLGNSAFLNPMPIRIVFSSLFMVEGFVTASNVAFHKFNENMVPTVCQVTLSVQALYIGFARKNSYITQQLEQQITQEITNAEDDEAATKVARIALEKQTQAELVNMAMSYIGWASAEQDYIERGNYSLNQWWEKIYDANIQYYYTDPSKYYKVRYTLANFSNGGTESFRFWTSAAFKVLVNQKAAITNLQITSLKLYFYDASDKAFTDWATDDKIREYSNSGKLSFGSYKNLKPIAKCNVFKLDTPLSETQGYTGNDYKKSDLSSIESNKLIEASKESPYEINWVTDDMESVLNFDEDRIKKNKSKYFGDSVKIVAQLTMTATWSGAGGGDMTKKVIKTAVQTFNPNTVITDDLPFGIDFGFWYNNND